MSTINLQLPLDCLAGLGSDAPVAKGTRNIVTVSGPKLVELREKNLRITQQELAALAGLSVSTVSRLERSADAGIHGKNFRRIADALKITPDELAKRLAAPGSKPKPDPEFPSGVKKILPVKMVPQFETPLAASRTADLGDPKPIRLVPLPVEGRAFLTVVEGDCMEPTYRNGQLVVFGYDIVDREGLVDGHPYYVQLSDGSGTFKLVYRNPEDGDALLLVALNAKKYPKHIRVHRDEVVRIAKALGTYAPIVTGENGGSDDGGRSKPDRKRRG